MQLAKLKLDEESELEFSLQIFGTTEQSRDIRFVIEGTNYDLAFNGIYENGSVRVKIPKLKGILESGEHNCKLEVVVGDKIFAPLKESIEFDSLVEVDVGKVKVESVQEDVKISNVKVNVFKPKTHPMMEQAKKQGFIIEEHFGLNLLKKDNKFYGYVTEEKLVNTNVGYDSVESIIESLHKQLKG